MEIHAEFAYPLSKVQCSLDTPFVWLRCEQSFGFQPSTTSLFRLHEFQDFDPGLALIYSRPQPVGWIRPTKQAPQLARQPLRPMHCAETQLQGSVFVLKLERRGEVLGVTPPPAHSHWPVSAINQPMGMACQNNRQLEKSHPFPWTQIFMKHMARQAGCLSGKHFKLCRQADYFDS